MTDLIQEIEKAIIDRAANHTKENIYDEYSSANFEEGALFALNIAVPLLKKAIEQRDNYISEFCCGQHGSTEHHIKDSNGRLLKLLGSENE